MPARPINAAAVSTIAVITVIGILIRLININESLWLDELHSSWSVAGSFWEVAQRAGDGNQAPLYYWVAWLVKWVLGNSEFSERFLSLLCGSALIPVSWWTVRRFTGSEIGALTTALLVMIDPLQIYYSTEFRSYIAVCLVGVLQTYAFTRVLMNDPPRRKKLESEPKDKKAKRTGQKPEVQTSASIDGDNRKSDNMFRRRLTFILLTLLLFHLHYTAILLLFVQVLLTCAALVFKSVRDRYSVKMMLIDGGIIVAGCAVAIPHMLRIGGKKDDWGNMISFQLVDELLGLFAAYVIPAGLIILAWICMRGMSADKSGKPLQPLLRAGIFSFGFAALALIVWLLTLSEIAALLHTRYLAASIALPLVGVGLAIGLFRRWELQLCIAVFAIAASFVSNQRFNEWYQESTTSHAVMPIRGESWSDVVFFLNQQPHKSQQDVYLLSAIVEEHRLSKVKDDEAGRRFVDYCKFPLKGLYALDSGKYTIKPLESFRRDGRMFAEEDLEQLKNNKAIWIVARGNIYGENGEVDHRLPGAIALDELFLRLREDGWQMNHARAPYYYKNLTVVQVWATKMDDIKPDSDSNRR